MERMRARFLSLFAAGLLSAGFAPALLAQNHPGFEAYCRAEYAEIGTCPEDLCVLDCPNDSEPQDCEAACVPLACTDIIADDCPEKFCAPMKDCSGNTICHYQMAGGRPACGNLAYGGQDVQCCPGLVRRCGLEFLDATCDMEGVNSVYNIPICLPCGDGKCTQFENRCNCPEDCGGKSTYSGIKFDAEALKAAESLKSQPVKSVADAIPSFPSRP